MTNQQLHDNPRALASLAVDLEEAAWGAMANSAGAVEKIAYHAVGLMAARAAQRATSLPQEAVHDLRTARFWYQQLQKEDQS